MHALHRESQPHTSTRHAPPQTAHDPQARLNVNLFPGEDPAGPIDRWLSETVIPPIEAGTVPRVALIAVWVGELPPWLDYTVRTMSFAADKGECARQLASP